MSTTPGTSGHLDDLLVDLLLGELDDRALVDAEAHLASCSACAARLTSLAGVRSLVAEHAPLPAPSESLWEGIQSAIRLETAPQPGVRAAPPSPGLWSRIRWNLGTGALAAASGLDWPVSAAASCSFGVM